MAETPARDELAALRERIAAIVYERDGHSIDSERQIDALLAAAANPSPAPALRTALDELSKQSAAQRGSPTDKDAWVANGIDQAVHRIRAALAAPGDEALSEAFRPLLSWAESCSQHYGMLRQEPPFTSTRALKDALASAYAALHPAAAPAREGEMECPMCGGEGRIYDITDAINAAQEQGTTLVPLRAAAREGDGT